MSLFSMMESVCTVERATISRDANQGVVQDPWTELPPARRTVVSGIACSIQQAGTNVQMLYGQRNTFNVAVAYFAQDPGAEVNDRVQITDRTGVTSYYLALGVAQAVGRGRLWSLDLTLIDAPT